MISYMILAMLLVMFLPPMISISSRLRHHKSSIRCIQCVSIPSREGELGRGKERLEVLECSCSTLCSYLANSPTPRLAMSARPGRRQPHVPPRRMTLHMPGPPDAPASRRPRRGRGRGRRRRRPHRDGVLPSAGTMHGSCGSSRH